MKKFLSFLICLLNLFPILAEDIHIFESVPGGKHSFEVKKGFLVKHGDITVNEETYPVVFILDTGACSSSYDSKGNPAIISKIEQNDGFIFASFDDVDIQNWKISSYNLGTILTKEFPEDTFFILVGNDVLIHKSLYLSILDGYFYWGENKNLDDSCIKKELVCHEEDRHGKLCYRYSFVDEDKHFSTGEESVQSAYLIDTGMYVASASQKEYSSVVNEKKYAGFYHPAVPNGKFYHFGVCKVNNPKVLGTDFDFLYYSCGYNFLNDKIYGLQVLSKFDIYFDCDNSEIAKYAYFYPQDDDKYCAFRKLNDSDSSVQNYTYGFSIAWDNKINMKFYIDGKELYPEISEGDEVISFIEKQSGSFITVKKTSGKTVKLKIKKHYF